MVSLAVGGRPSPAVVVNQVNLVVVWWLVSERHVWRRQGIRSSTSSAKVSDSNVNNLS
jgi:hypothetical protein